MAEAHPVGFQWVMEAKARGATIIHVDPRFSRTSAVANLHVPIRAGADIAFVGGLINYVLQNDKYFHDYVVNYTNAPTIIDEDFRDTEDLDGLFSGFDPEHRTYDWATWRYQGDDDIAPASGARGMQRHHKREVREAARGEAHGSGGAAAHPEPDTDPTLQHPRCVFQILKRHFARYTAGDGGRGGRGAGGAVLPGGPRDHGELRPGPDHRVRVQPGLDPAHGGRAVHPDRGHPAVAARQHGPARRRHPGDARARLDPGLHRHPHPVRPAARLPADAVRARRAARRPGRLCRGREDREGLLGQHAELHGQPAQGVLG